MRKRKSPQEKKRLSLAKDHPLQAEYPHGFRKSWTVKERKAQKGYRTRVRQELLEAIGGVGPAADEPVDTERIRRRIVRKWRGGRPLGEVIKLKQARRIRSYRRKKNAQSKRSGGS